MRKGPKSGQRPSGATGVGHTYWILSPSQYVEKTKSLSLDVKLSESVYKRRNRKRKGKHLEPGAVASMISPNFSPLPLLPQPQEQRLTAAMPVTTFYQTFFSIERGCVRDGGVKMVGECSFITTVRVPFLNDEYRLPYPSGMVQNVQASWPSAVVFLVCSSATFWPRRMQH